MGRLLKGVKLDGYSVAMSELDIVLRYLRLTGEQYAKLKNPSHYWVLST